jgi:hypothetical protein
MCLFPPVYFVIDFHVLGTKVGALMDESISSKSMVRAQNAISLLLNTIRLNQAVACYLLAVIVLTMNRQERKLE